MARASGVEAVRKTYRALEPEGFNVPRRTAAELGALAGLGAQWHFVARAEPFVDEVVFSPERGVLGLTAGSCFAVVRVERKEFDTFELPLADVATVREIRRGLVRFATSDALHDWCLLPLHVKPLLDWLDDLLPTERPVPPKWSAVPFAWPATASYRGDHPDHPTAKDEVELVADASGLRVSTLMTREVILDFAWPEVVDVAATGDQAIVKDGAGVATFVQRQPHDALERILRPAAQGYER